MGEIKSLIFKDEKLMAFKQILSEDHLIFIMLTEHEIILEYLDELYNVNQEIQKINDYSSSKAKFRELSELIEKFYKTELHHQREEEVLFPQLDKRGLFSEPFMMQAEHDLIREYLDELKALSNSINEEKFNIFKKRINTLIKFLIIKISENISEENSTLYPEAVKAITEQDVWYEMKKQSDQLGYFKF